jgi:hypothetical protein
MKKIIILTVFLLAVATAFSQQSFVTVSGGYSFAKVEDTDAKITGYRINGLYEFNPYGQKWAYGLSFGYLNLKGSTNDRDYNITSLPLYFAPKYMTGSEKLKSFIKGAFGIQLSNIESTGSTTNLSDHDYGFVAGAGAGLMYFFNEKIFLNAEYEIMWMSNSYYRSGWINTISGGLGVKF